RGYIAGQGAAGYIRCDCANAAIKRIVNGSPVEAVLACVAVDDSPQATSPIPLKPLRAVGLAANFEYPVRYVAGAVSRCRDRFAGRVVGERIGGPRSVSPAGVQG